MPKTIVAFFTNQGSPETGLTPTIRIWDIGAGALVVTDEAMTELGDGFYHFSFAAYDENKDYAIRCDGGNTLDDFERYVFAGNESYVEDIWGAKTGHHNLPGSFGSAVVSGGGAVLSSAEGRPLSKGEMEEFARLVWEVMVDNQRKAKDVLLTRSDFDAARDEVTAKGLGNLQAEMKDGLEQVKAKVDDNKVVSVDLSELKDLIAKLAAKKDKIRVEKVEVEKVIEKEMADGRIDHILEMMAKKKGHEHMPEGITEELKQLRDEQKRALKMILLKMDIKGLK